MNRKSIRRHLLALSISLSLSSAAVQAVPMLAFEEKWSVESDFGAEIVAIDAASGRVFSTFPSDADNNEPSGVEVRNISNGSLIGTFMAPNDGEVNSVAVKNGIVAVAVAASTKTENGTVVFYDAQATDPDTASVLGSVEVGALPDMVTFNPTDTKLQVLVANEGEPNDDYNIDPEGSVSVIDITDTSSGSFSYTVDHLDFRNLLNTGTEKTDFENAGGRLFGPNKDNAAKDLEPEYIAVSPDGKQAFVTLQENNAVAIIDLDNNTITDIQGPATALHPERKTV